MPHHFGQRVDGAVDEARAVVRGHDADAGRQTGLQLLDLVFDAQGDGERVFTVPHHDDAPGDLVAVLFVDAAAELRAELDGGDVLDVDGDAVVFLDDDVLDVADALDPADAADEVFGVILLDDAAADGQVAAGDGVVQLAERDAPGAQGFGADVDLVFHRQTAEHGDVGDASRGIELRDDVELVERPEFGRIERLGSARLHGVVENLSHGGRVGRQIGRHSLG